MEAVTVCPLVYVLELQDDCWYIGSTHNLNFRYAQHLMGKGAGWTRLHKPIRVAEVIFEEDGETGLKLENTVTKRYMEEYGRDNVKGGSWTKCAKPVDSGAASD